MLDLQLIPSSGHLSILRVATGHEGGYWPSHQYSSCRINKTFYQSRFFVLFGFKLQCSQPHDMTKGNRSLCRTQNGVSIITGTGVGFLGVQQRVTDSFSFGKLCCGHRDFSLWAMKLLDWWPLGTVRSPRGSASIARHLPGWDISEILVQSPGLFLKRELALALQAPCHSPWSPPAPLGWARWRLATFKCPLP